MEAPTGADVAALPDEVFIVTVGSQTYSFFGGAFYRWDSDRDAYVVVEPPEGAEVPFIPEGYTVADHDGVLYYVYGDVYYRPVLREGVTVYVVTKF